MSVCVSVCLSARISPEPRVRSLPSFLCMLPMSLAQSSSGMLTKDHIAYRREGVTGVSGCFQAAVVLAVGIKVTSFGALMKLLYIGPG